MELQIIDPANEQGKTEVNELERNTTSLIEKCAIFSAPIADSAAAQGIADLVVALKNMRKFIEGHHRPNIERWDKGHKAAIQDWKKMDAPLEQAQRQGEKCFLDWKRDQERIAREEAAKLQAKAKKDAEDAQIKAAEAAHAAGNAPMAEAMLNRPVYVPSIPMPKPAVKVSTRKNWKCREQVNLAELIPFVAAHPEHFNLLAPNLKALSALAKAMEEKFNIPGCQAFNDEGFIG